MGKSDEPKHSKPAPDRLLLAVVSILAFLPIGIVAVVSALKVRSHNDNGDYDEAHTAAKSTQDWIIISFINGFFFYFGLLAIILVFTGDTLD